MTTSEVYFVWTLVNGKPYNSKWYGLKIHLATGKEEQAAQKHLLTEKEVNLTLNELAEKYPFKRNTE